MSETPSANEALLRAQQAVELNSAERTFGILGCAFSLLHEEWLDRAVEGIHHRDRERLIEFFMQNWGFRSLAKKFDRTLRAVEQSDLRDPRVFINLCLLLAPLQDEYVPGLDPRHQGSVRLHLENATARMAGEIPAVFVDQVAALSACVGRILMDLPSRRPPDGGRLILLELPVGNSVPVKVLQRVLLARGYSVEVWRVALNRNDLKEHGITRVELLGQMFDHERPQKGDLILYLDEWLTGSNFKNVLKTLRRVVGKESGVNVWPIGLLATDAASQSHYAGCCKLQDQFLAEMGLLGSDYRIVVPDFQSRFRGDARFFWSETDRFAGYRKMQFLGSLLSTLHAAVDQLRADPAALREAKFRCMHEAAKADGLSFSWDVLRDEVVFNSMFEDAYQDYIACQPILNDIELLSNTAAIEGSWEEAWDQVTSAVNQVVGNRKAQMCALLALGHITAKGWIDPANRHYFRGHAPVVVELDGPVRRFHELVVDRLTDTVLRDASPA